MSSLLLALLLAARPFTPEELLATRRADDVQVSPDGKWASVTVRQKNLTTNKDDKDIWLLPLPSGPARQFTRDARSEHAPWSPDGKQIAGHTDRFKCLVSHDGVFDPASAYFSTEELWFPEWEFRGPPWEDAEPYRKLSPSSYVQNFKTPTLVVQGELDFRVPVEQGLGMFTALQRRGVESRLLCFPDEGHWVLKPKNSQLWYHTVLDWIDPHARPGSKQAARP